MAAQADTPCPPDACGGPTICNVIGQVTQIKDNPASAVVHLQKLYGSSTLQGCQENYNEDVTVSLDMQPKPHIDSKDVVAVALAPGSSAQLEPPQPLENLLTDAEFSYGSPLSESEWLYQIKAFLGVESTMATLEGLLKTETKDTSPFSDAVRQRRNSALLLLVLAKANYPVPPAVISEACNISVIAQPPCKSATAGEQNHQGAK